MHTPILIMIVGPTAVGKTAVSIRLAQHFSTEIVSADARQFYQEMTIGTAKPTAEELQQVRHHLVDFLPVRQPYDVKQFEHDALRAIQQIHARRPYAIATGGSGLYVQTLVRGIDEMPEVPAIIRQGLQQRWQQEGLLPLLAELQQVDPHYFAEVDQRNHRRVLRALEVYHSTHRPYSSFRRPTQGVTRPFRTLTIGLCRPREILYQRIDQRVDAMIAQGLIAEAQALYPWRNYQALRTVGYQECFPVVDGEYDVDEAIRLIKRNSRRYAKRQLTWFRKDSTICWFDVSLGMTQTVQNIIAHIKDATALTSQT